MDNTGELAKSLSTVDDASFIYESNVDLLTRDRVRLWVWLPSDPTTSVDLDIYIDDACVGHFTADEYRQDLFAAGKGDGRHGLDLNLKAMTAPFKPESNLNIEIFTAVPSRFLLVSRRLTGTEFSLDNVDPAKLHRLSLALSPLFMGVANRMDNRPERHRPPVAHPLAERMCEPTRMDGFRLARRETDLVISNYADFVRQRFKIDTRFQPSESEAEASHYLKWYLESYCPMRGEVRAPLASHEISYLNELITIGGQQHHLSRANYMFLFDNLGLLAGLNLNQVESYLSVVYWWAIERARSLFVEDCLVPTSYRNLLLSVRGSWSKRPYPLSRFMEVYFSRHPAWHMLELELEEDRVLLYVALLLTATNTPTILQYVPQAWLRRMTVSVDGRDPLFATVCKLLQNNAAANDYRFDEIMQASGFDLYSSRSLSISPSRHRLHSASLPRPPASLDPCHVQIIGPMRLASGLGQASRLSASALAETGYGYSAHAFDLDNPAPTGFATATEVGDLVCPGVNLLHLNAESVPLAFAYLPDAFTESYNIGYFFWELDSPAKCHQLGVSMLDEIWVSSEYGAEIYRHYTDKPVINVGMAIEDVEIPDRAEARLFLQRCTGIGRNEFTFITAFDSFSFVQRKNPQAVVRAFKAAFQGDEPVRLVLKTHNRDFVDDHAQLRVWQALHEEIESDPRIVVVNETLSYTDLIRLKCGCDCYVSLHRSEGWGFGMAEAMNLGIPVIATGYSGNLEFCKPSTCWLVDYELKPLGPDDYIFVSPGQRWAEPDVRHAAQQMRAVFEQPDERAARSMVSQKFIKQNFSSAAVGARYAAQLDRVFAARGLASAKAPRPRAKPIRAAPKAAVGVGP